MEKKLKATQKICSKINKDKQPTKQLTQKCLSFGFLFSFAMIFSVNRNPVWSHNQYCAINEK